MDSPLHELALIGAWALGIPLALVAAVTLLAAVVAVVTAPFGPEPIWAKLVGRFVACWATLMRPVWRLLS